MPASDICAIAAALGLGTVHGTPTNLKPTDSNPIWAVDTERGQWIIKTQRPSGPWWFTATAQAATLERAALARGVPIPEPAPGIYDGVGLWQPITDDLYARAMIRVRGHHPTTPLEPRFAAWVGRCLATIEAIALTAEPATDTGYRVHPTTEWDDWIRQARTIDALSTDEAATLRHVVSELNPLIAAGAAEPRQLLHRDISRVNIIITDRGPLLLDFDHAGPQVPWWECVGHVFNLASGHLGREEPSRATIDEAVTAYIDAGARPGQADATAFTGTLAARLSFAAFLLWIALGNRRADPAHRARAISELQDAIVVLPAIFSSLDRWAQWLR